MIRRFFSLLLVLLMLANQGLCLAHVHHGNEFAEPEGHGSRPHFHVGSHGCHDSAHNHQHTDHSHPDHLGNIPETDEHDATLPPAFSPVAEHDSDAVYCGEPVTIVRGGSSANVLSERDATGVAIIELARQGNGLQRLGPLRGRPPSVFDAACPVFMRTLSLRI